jgi:TusE/DsrC/DsvC family sulfur relay protein
MPLEISGRSLAIDDEGYLMDPSDWNDEVAEVLAQREQIALTQEHWSVIRFMREYFDSHQIAPDARHVMKHLAELKGTGKAGRNDLFVLFPYGYVKQACKIAGMRRPRAWSTG